MGDRATLMSGWRRITAFLGFLPVIMPAALIQLYVFYRRAGEEDGADLALILFQLPALSRAHSTHTRTIAAVRGKHRALHLFYRRLSEPNSLSLFVASCVCFTKRQ